MIIVTASRTHRRANMEFQRGVPVTLDPQKLTPAQLEALAADPELAITEGKLEAPAEPIEPNLTVEERVQKIAAIIPDLGASDTNKDGSPKVKVVSEKVGFDATKSEIEEAVAALVKDGEGDDGSKSTD